MTAEVLSLQRPGAGGRPPLVPTGVDLQEDEIFLRLPAWIFDSEWAIECSRDERLAGITLRTRALKQVGNAGSLPASDRLLARLADFGDDVQGWASVKARALEGWVLCADGRWHHPEIARNVLHIWIGRLEARRISAWGNKGRVKKGNGRSLDSIMGDMDAALDALAAIDPQDAVLGRGADQQIKWRERIAENKSGSGELPPVGTESPYEGPNRSPNRSPSEGGPKVRQAKRSQENSSSLLCRDDSGDEGNSSRQETEIAQSPAKRTAEWPSPGEAREQLRAAYPKWKNPGDIDKALAAIRKGGRVAFDAILVGAERVRDAVRAGKDPQFVPYPARWLRARGWEDDPDPPPDFTSPRGPPPPRGPSEPSINLRAAQRAAERLGLHGEHRPGG